MRRIKESVCKLSQYSVSQDDSLIKLNQNESPFDIPLKIKEEIFNRMKKVSWNRYPLEGADLLIQKISEYTDFSSHGIMVGNGSNELIQAIIHATCDSGDKILTVQPGFSIYKRIAAVMNIETIEVPLKKNFSFDKDIIIEKGKKARLVILASPNNPTGTVLTLEKVKKIAQNINGILALDEAYYEFYKKTAQNLIDEINNIIILRTFSKALGSAGIRLGYLLGKNQIVKELRKAKLPFSLGGFQQMAGEIVMKRKEFIVEGVKRILMERDRVFDELTKFQSIQPIPSDANFILFQSKNMSGKELFEILFKNRILVRYFDIPRLKNMLRVTIGTHEENNLFLGTLRQITEGGSYESGDI